MAKKQKYETVFLLQSFGSKKSRNEEETKNLLSNYKRLNSSSLLTLNWLLANMFVREVKVG